MGFSVLIETDYGEKLSNHPSVGNAVFAFLMGLLNYCDWGDSDKETYDSLMDVVEWYQHFDSLLNMSLCTTCRPLLACIWGDGGDPTEYNEDEFASYQHRVGRDFTVTEVGFQRLVQSYHESYQPIEDVMEGIKLLLESFHALSLEPLSGFYEPEDTIPDFEALYANLELLLSRDNERVRLNFR